MGENIQTLLNKGDTSRGQLQQAQLPLLFLKNPSWLVLLDVVAAIGQLTVEVLRLICVQNELSASLSPAQATDIFDVWIFLADFVSPAVGTEMSLKRTIFHQAGKDGVNKQET